LDKAKIAKQGVLILITLILDGEVMHILSAVPA
jgi:hypothetical protein